MACMCQTIIEDSLAPPGIWYSSKVILPLNGGPGLMALPSIFGLHEDSNPQACERAMHMSMSHNITSHTRFRWDTAHKAPTMALRTLLQAGCRGSRSIVAPAWTSCSALGARGFASEEKVRAYAWSKQLCIISSSGATEKWLGSRARLRRPYSESRSKAETLLSFPSRTSVVSL